ncbi:MAG: DegT/DnrJ/EryC1/StrS family aminotransferase [Chitinophagaceae bacterium]|nr:DegT/DnrJ/EryC1/StrS family aminotransferase [Chitinophagaceae bacterium]
MSGISHNRPTLGIEEEQAAVRVIHSGWLAQGKEVETFENEFCDFLGIPHGHAVAVSSGTAALYLALCALNAQGKKVALPVYSCSALRNAVAMSGSQAVFIDTSPGSPNVTCDVLNASGAEVVIVPHMYGLPIDLTNVGNIDVIEDCAQALGAAVKGMPVGLQGKIGVYSFYATKLITSGGQGGLIASRERSLADSIRDYREFDCRHDRKNRFNFQMTDLQAAIGRIQLSKLPTFLARRSEIFDHYKSAGLNMLDVMSGTGSVPVRYRAVMKTSLVEEIIASLKAKGVKAIVPIEDWELLDTSTAYPNAFRITRETVSLPIYPSLSDVEVETVISAVGKR